MAGPLSQTCEGKVATYRYGFAHIASVELDLIHSAETSICFRLKGRGFQTQGSLFDIGADDWLEWQEAGAQGARFALVTSGLNAQVVVRRISGMPTDTNASIVALAAARAVWNADGQHADPAAIKKIESAAFSSWLPGAAAVPSF